MSKPRPIPEGYHSVTPYLMVNDCAKAIDFYKKAFGATELARMPMPDGRIGHAEIKIGDSPIMLADDSPQATARSPKALNGTSIGIAIYVEDCDALIARAIEAGATVVRPIQNQFYGDRSGTILDPFGHLWTIGTHIEDVSPEEMKRRMDEMMKKK
jgi:PhnB protein